MPAFQHSTFNIIVLMKRIFYLTSSSTKAFFFLFFLACAAGLNAQTATLSVQGVLTKSDGTAVDDGNEYDLTFRLWKSESSTNPADKVHQETITNISIVGGVYSVVLGVTTPMTAAFDTTYWLGVSVNTSNVELLPRPRLTHAPYALAIVGNNNTFPSTGPVKADAFRARGGQPIGGQGSDGNGFSFKPGGDQGGGMYSREPNNIELWAGGQERMQLNNVQNEMYGNLVNFGTFTSNTQTVNGDHTTNGNSQVNGWQVVTGDERVEGNQFCNKKFLTKQTSEDGGYSFDNDGGYDSGLFGDNPGVIRLKSNGYNRFTISPFGTYFDTPVGNTEIGTSGEFVVAIGGNYYLLGMKAKGSGGNWKNVQVDIASGLVQYDNSSRRFKRNIRPLVDDFSLILKAQPRVYNRLDNDTTYHELGYIAEEMDSIGLHNLVQYDTNGVIDGFDYDKMILYTVEVLKIQDAALKDLRAELEAMKAENITLKNKNKGLSAENGSLTQQQAKFSAQLESLSKRMLLLESSNDGESKK